MISSLSVFQVVEGRRVFIPWMPVGVVEAAGQRCAFLCVEWSAFLYGMDDVPVMIRVASDWFQGSFWSGAAVPGFSARPPTSCRGSGCWLGVHAFTSPGGLYRPTWYKAEKKIPSFTPCFSPRDASAFYWTMQFMQRLMAVGRMLSLTMDTLASTRVRPELTRDGRPRRTRLFENLCQTNKLKRMRRVT